MRFTEHFPFNCVSAFSPPPIPVNFSTIPAVLLIATGGAVSGATVLETSLVSHRDAGSDWANWVSNNSAHSVSRDFVRQNLEDALTWFSSGPSELGNFVTSNNELIGVGSIRGEMVIMSDRAILLLFGSDPSFTAYRLNLLSGSSMFLRTLLEGELFAVGMDTTEISGPRGREALLPNPESDDPQVRFFYSGTFGLEGAEWASFSQTITSDRLVLSLAGQDGIFQNVAFQPIPEPTASALLLAAMACMGRRRFFRTGSAQSPPA